MRDRRVAALIPCLDAGRTVGSVVEGVRAFVETVLVVDDGSADASVDAAQASGAEVLRQPRNLGKGAALRRGFAQLGERGFTHVVTLDADGQHLPSEVPGILEFSERKPDALIIGARRRDGVHEIAPIKRFGNDFADGWVERAGGPALKDSQSGFRVYPLLALKEVLRDVRGARFEFESEVVILACRRGVEIDSIDIEVHYPPPEERHSHYRPWLDTLRIIRMVVPFWRGWRN